MSETKQEVFESLLREYDVHKLLWAEDYKAMLTLVGTSRKRWLKRYAEATGDAANNESPKVQPKTLKA